MIKGNKVTFSEGKPVTAADETTASHQKMVVSHHGGGQAHVDGLKLHGQEVHGSEVTKTC